MIDPPVIGAAYLPEIWLTYMEASEIGALGHSSDERC